MTMKNFLKKILVFLSGIGMQPLKFFLFIKELPAYFIDLALFKKQLKINDDFHTVSLYPILGEKYETSGSMSGHYFYQDFLVARMIYQHNPAKHVDIGSRIDGFVAHVAAFRAIEVFDIRPQYTTVANIIFTQADMMDLSDNLVDYCDSISSLHAIEHFGLGRYGDKIDCQGHLKAIENIFKILKKGGKFYFSVPIGKPRVVFNAHRIFSVKYLCDFFAGRYRIDSFSYVDDKGDLFPRVSMDMAAIKNNFNCNYGCGIWEMTKY